MELDWLEERGGIIHAFEAKWNPKRRSSLPFGFEEAYPNSIYEKVSPDNYMDFLTTKA